MINAGVRGDRELVFVDLGDDLVVVLARAVGVDMRQLGAIALHTQIVDHLAVALREIGLAQKVGAALPLGDGAPDRQELRSHAMHVADEVLAGHIGERRGELNDDVRVRGADDVVHDLGEGLLRDAALDHPVIVEARVLQVVGVRDADDVLIDIRPPIAVVVPV